MTKNLMIYSMLIVYLLLNIFVFDKVSIPLYNELINPIMWIIMCGFAIYLSRDDGQRVKDSQNKTQSLVIALIIYIIFYFLLGLAFGFQKTPYDKSFLNIIKNIWMFGGVIFFQEIIRNATIKIESKKTYNFIAITILMILVNITYTSLGSHYTDIKEAFIYTTSIMIPLIVTHGVLTYFSYVGGARLPIIYRLFMTIPPLIIPIIPDLDWFLTAVLGVTVPLAIFIYVNYIHINKSERLSRRARGKYSPVRYVPFFIIIVLAVCFVIGVFKYQPIAILSGSMSPTFNRGDAVVIKKLNTKEKDELKKGDIIQFINGSKFVVHRIEGITNDENGNKLFITKGDANNARDVDKTNMEQVIGKVTVIVPYVGYPSVWLSGMVS